MTGRSTTRLLKPPGGQSSFSIGWDNNNTNSHAPRTGKSLAHGTANINGGGIGQGSARLFNQTTGSQNKARQQSSFSIGYQKDADPYANGANTGRRSSLSGMGRTVMNASTSTTAGVSSKNPYYTQHNSGRMGMMLGAGRNDGLMLPTQVKVTANTDRHAAYLSKNFGGITTTTSSVSNYNPTQQARHMAAGNGSGAIPTHHGTQQNNITTGRPVVQQNTGAQNKAKHQSSISIGYQPSYQQQPQQPQQQQQYRLPPPPPLRQQQQQQQQQQQRFTMQQQERMQDSNQMSYSQIANARVQQNTGGVLGGSANSYGRAGSVDQNNGNVMTGRSTTRRLAPPGGFSSFSLG